MWHADAFLIFSQPSALKVRNIQNNPQIALNFHTDADGGNVVVFSGEAQLDLKPVPTVEVAAYLQKYDEGIKMIGMTPESMAQTYSMAIRMTPTRVRATD